MQAQFHTVIECLETHGGNVLRDEPEDMILAYITKRKEGGEEGRGNPKLQEEKRTRNAPSTHGTDLMKAFI